MAILFLSNGAYNRINRWKTIILILKDAYDGGNSTTDVI
jgi:hypothetical protein